MTKKSTSNKGFTLVELIVVLVILAILAAILVPALLGYIDRAREKQIVLNAKSCLTAAQAEMSSLYGQNLEPSKIATDPYNAEVLSTADVPNCTALVVGTKKNYGSTTNKSDLHDMYTISYVAYTEGGKTTYFNGTAWVDEAVAAPASSWSLK